MAQPDQLKLNMSVEAVRALLPGSGGPPNIQANELFSTLHGSGYCTMPAGAQSGFIRSAFDNDELPGVFAWLCKQEAGSETGAIQLSCVLADEGDASSLPIIKANFTSVEIDDVTYYGWQITLSGAGTNEPIKFRLVEWIEPGGPATVTLYTS